jgi:hypothetical protein
VSAARVERLAPWACWLVGLLACFGPTFASGFATVQGYPGNDPRLVAFILEHSYRWLAGLPGHGDFWSPPIFFPERGVGAYTEMLVGTGPPYWLARALGASPLTAYQLWMLACWSLNFVAGYAMLRAVLAVGRAPASAGAYLFAFGSARMATMMHQQLVPYFFPVLAIIAAARVLANDTTHARAATWIALFALALAAQAYTSLYVLYFFVLALVAALAWALLLPALRRPLLAALRRHAPALALGAVAAAALVAPLGLRYLGAADDVGVRAHDVERLPRVWSWLLMGPGNLVWGWLDHRPRFAPWSRPMHHNGLGFVTLALASVGLVRARRSPAVVVLVLATATVFLLTLRLPGDASLWPVTRRLVPGGEAIRAVARVGALLLFAGAAGLALFFAQQRRRWPAVALIALAALSFTEQVNVSYGFDKRFAEWRTDRLGSAVDPACRSFFLVASGVATDHDVQDDAMWVALATGVPTVNGRSGAKPPGWDLDRASVTSEQERARLRSRLDAWRARHALQPGDVCWIEVDRRAEAAAWTSVERSDQEQR